MALMEDISDRIIDEQKLNSIIQALDGHKRVPLMIDDFSGEEEIFLRNKLTNNEKINFFVHHFGKLNPNLMTFMKESNCTKITMPKEDPSYKRHVEDAFKSYQAKKNFVIDLNAQDKESNCWIGIIDNRLNRLFVIVWVVNFEGI
jgi:hypothetical protein